MALNLSKITPASLKAKEVATQEYVDTTTANAISSSEFVLPSEVAAAINNNTTTIDGSKITTGSIQAGAIAAGAITADKVSADVFSGQTIIGGNIYGTRIEGASILGAVIKSSWIDYSNTGVLTNWQYFTPATVPSQYVGNFAKNTNGSLVVDSMGYVRLPGSNVVRTEAHTYSHSIHGYGPYSIPPFTIPLRSYDYYYDDTPNRYINSSFILEGSATIGLGMDFDLGQAKTSVDLAVKIGNELYEVYVYETGDYDLTGTIKVNGNVVHNIFMHRVGDSTWSFTPYGINVSIQVYHNYAPYVRLRVTSNSSVRINNYTNIRNLIELVRGRTATIYGSAIPHLADVSVGLFTAQN